MEDFEHNNESTGKGKDLDQRRHARFDIVEYAHIFSAGESQPLSGLVVDISLGGLQTRTRGALKAKSACTMVIGQGGQPPLELDVEVRYSLLIEGSDLYASGFKFKPKTVSDRMILVDYIHEVFTRSGESMIDNPTSPS